VLVVCIAGDYRRRSGGRPGVSVRGPQGPLCGRRISVGHGRVPAMCPKGPSGRMVLARHSPLYSVGVRYGSIPVESLAPPSWGVVPMSHSRRVLGILVLVVASLLAAASPAAAASATGKNFTLPAVVKTTYSISGTVRNNSTGAVVPASMCTRRVRGASSTRTTWARRPRARPAPTPSLTCCLARTTCGSTRRGRPTCSTGIEAPPGRPTSASRHRSSSRSRARRSPVRTSGCRPATRSPAR